MVSLVTGSSKGIGRAIAVRLAREGYSTYVTYLNDLSGAEETARIITKEGGEAKILHLDVRSEVSVRNAIAEIEAHHNRLNVLINNAGTQVPKSIDALSFEEWKNVIETKIDGAFLCAKYALPLLKASDNANLIFVSSSLAFKPIPSGVAYSVASAGAIALMKALAVSLGPYGIRTNAVAPGKTLTKMWDSLGGDNDELWSGFAEENPMRRVCTPEDVAALVMLVVADSSRYLNGNVIFLDGGNYLR